MNRQVEKPITRSLFRLYCGSKYFCIKRHFKWIFSNIKFAKIVDEELQYNLFSHATPLLRKLTDVEMYLQYNKITNLKIALKKVNKVTIFPGETFSYWKLIGKPTKRKGYAKGMVLTNGTIKAGTGGGLCQLSNLIYWITIHTELTVIERHRHGYDVFPDSNRTQPFGSGATCFYNYGDLMIRNDTDRIYQLELEMTEQELKGTWKSDSPLRYKYHVYEKEHLMKPEYWGGYTRHNIIYRKKYDLQDNLIDDEFVVENHALMTYSPFLESKSNTIV